LQTIKKIINLLDRDELIGVRKLVLIVILVAFFDLVGIASIMPFMSLVANINLVDSNEYLFWVYTNFDFDNKKQFLFFLGILVFSFLILSLALRALMTYQILKFTYEKQYLISKRLLNNYLEKPYLWIISRHSSELSKNILTESSVVVEHGLMPLIILITNSILVGSIALLLIFFTPALFLGVLGVFSISYFFIYKFVYKKIDLFGKERLKNNEKRFQVVEETFSLIKFLKINELYKKFTKNYFSAAKNYSSSQTNAMTIKNMPKFLIEAVVFGGMIVVTLFLINSNKEFHQVISILSLYAIAGYKLMPSIQQIFGSISQLRFAGPSLDLISSQLFEPRKDEIDLQEEIYFNKNIKLKNVTFFYDKSNYQGLSSINLTINRGSNIAFIGSTGSGKTTLVDLIIGLICPQNGAIYIDDTKLSKFNYLSWQRKIGYVPQNVILFDGSLAENIALSGSSKEIDMQKVVNVAKIAMLDDYIENLPAKYESMVGDKGSKLSGGQKQRLGIARALYQSPSVLILDEATSALDSSTEKKLLNELKIYSKDITLLMITHKESTLNLCEKIYMLNEGKINPIKNHRPLIKKNKIP